MLSTFTDKLGRSWSISITIGTLQRVKKETGIAIADPFVNPSAVSFMDDPFQFGAVLYSLCGAEKAGINSDSFADGFDGPTLDAALSATLAALTDFFQRGQKGAAVKKHLPTLLAKQDSEAGAKIDEALSKSATNLPHSPESETPDRTPSVS